jgi:hypothetical protein
MRRAFVRVKQANQFVLIWSDIPAASRAFQAGGRVKSGKSGFSPPAAHATNRRDKHQTLSLTGLGYRSRQKPYTALAATIIEIKGPKRTSFLTAFNKSAARPGPNRFDVIREIISAIPGTGSRANPSSSSLSRWILAFFDRRATVIVFNVLKRARLR